MSRSLLGRHKTALILACMSLLAAGCADSIHDRAAMADLQGVSRLLEHDPSLLEARNPRGKTPLHMAVTSGSDAMVAALLSRGADVNAHDNTGLTPLHIAAWWTSTARAAVLLDAGADLAATDHFGDTPLHVAALHGRRSMTQFLLRRGAPRESLNGAGLTPLALATKHRQEKTVSLLEAPAPPASIP
ncbi:MAG: ankyrin repeat domain-containing protein [Candidatus Hydrogenedentes bacterium]|nr:ankyrin repeat domain-containing protein [Candidatus Hydrogenedentota bacterium]